MLRAARRGGDAAVGKPGAPTQESGGAGEQWAMVYAAAAHAKPTDPKESDDLTNSETSQRPSPRSADAGEHAAGGH
eukprot:994664-Lingulodinium_polyedra.AAC.1